MMIIENNKKVLEDEDREKSRLFKEELLKFNTLHGRENFKVPQIGGKELDLYKLFKEVISRGGSHHVSENKQWKEIVNALELPASCTSASFTLRNHYAKCLHSYESYYMKAQQNPGMNMNTLLGISTGANTLSLPNSTNLRENATSNMVSQPNPQQEQKFLGKKVVRPESEYNLVFRYHSKPATQNRDKILQKKVRLLNAVPDLRRVVLAFESYQTSEIVWALNMMLLFSANTNCVLQIDNQPYLLESMTNYMYYCINNISEFYFIIEILEGRHEKKQSQNPSSSNNHPRDYYNRSQSKRSRSFVEATTFNFLEEVNNTINLSTLSKKNKDLVEHDKILQENQVDTVYIEVTEFELLEHLISIVQIVRNLSFLRQNEPGLIKCSKFMNLIFLLFIHSNILEVRVNLLDIITNLAKHTILKEVRYPIELMSTLFELLRSPNRETAETALECLRRLTFASGNEDFFEKMPDEFYEELVNLLISFKIEIRESALEVLYCIADQKLETKTRLGKIGKCIQRLVALVCSNAVDNRIPKIASCTLAKLGEVPSILKIIMSYEQDLLLAACTDDSVSKIVLGIISN